MTGRVTWYTSRIHQITTVAPQRAFQAASLEAAGLGSRVIGGKGSGALARDVSRPKPTGVMQAYVGSSLPYARIENFGGTIKPKRAKRLLIRGQRQGVSGRLLRSTFGGAVVASASEVHHRGKHYLEVVVGAFPGRYLLHLRHFMPGGL